VNNLSIAIVHFSVYLFSIDILKFSKRCVLNTFIVIFFIPYTAEYISNLYTYETKMICYILPVYK